MVNQIVVIRQQQQIIKLWQSDNNNNKSNCGNGNMATTIVDQIMVMTIRQQQ